MCKSCQHAATTVETTDYANIYSEPRSQKRQHIKRMNERSSPEKTEREREEEEDIKKTKLLKQCKRKHLKKNHDT